MSECGDDWDPGRWSGYSYSSAQSAYNTNVDRYAGRGYGAGDMDALANEKVPERLHTDARSPLVILLDGTGSMGEFPEVIRKKLPVLDACVGDYLEEPAIALGMIHDARRGSRMPLQVEDFTDPDGILLQLQDSRYCGGAGYYGEICGTVENPTGRNI